MSSTIQEAKTFSGPFSLASAWDPELECLIQQICARRNRTLDWACEKRLSALAGYPGLHDVETACTLLFQALEAQIPFAVVGDYDVDGVTAAAVVLKALKAYGAQHVSYWVPNRLTEGYGLTTTLLERIPDGPGCLITVDNGIRAVEAVRKAKAKGWQVIITDHHQPSQDLPDAHAIVNPKLSSETFVPKHLAGVGVAFYLMLALRQQLKVIGWFQANNRLFPNAAVWLDLVALGTIADMVPLDLENRILVSQGLERLKKGQACPGIKALLHLLHLSNMPLTEKVFSHQLGPTLNAAGRLADMSIGLHLLMAEKIEQAMPFAKALCGWNRSRQTLQAETLQRLFQTAEANLDCQMRTKVLYLPEAHLGIIGLLATQLKEHFQTLAILFSDFDDVQIKGSLRSIPGLNAMQLLDKVNQRYPSLIKEFGGHAMAAGLTLQRAEFPLFASAVEEVFVDMQDDLKPVDVAVDGYLAEKHCNLQTLQAFEQLGPWGIGFPAPLFTGIFEWKSHKVLRGGHWEMEVKHPRSDRWQDAIVFFPPQNQFPAHDRLSPYFKAQYLLDRRYRRHQGHRVQLIMTRFVGPADFCDVGLTDSLAPPKAVLSLP